MAVYRGYRFVLPGQNSNDWRHNVTGEVGVYSNWQLQSSTHLLDEAPLEHHEPGTGRHPHGILLSQMYTGTQRYAPMELQKYIGYGQDVPYFRHAPHEFHGVDSARAIGGDYGHDGTREFTFSRFVNFGQLRVPSGLELDGGHPFRAYGEGIANMGPVEPYIYQGVGSDIVADPGQDYEKGRYGFEKVREWHGVPSAKAL